MRPDLLDPKLHIKYIMLLVLHRTGLLLHDISTIVIRRRRIAPSRARMGIAHLSALLQSVFLLGYQIPNPHPPQPQKHALIDCICISVRLSLWLPVLMHSNAAGTSAEAAFAT